MQLCRDVYHCTPSELDAQDFETVMQHVRFMEIEARLRGGGVASAPPSSTTAGSRTGRAAPAIDPNIVSLAKRLGIPTEPPPATVTMASTTPALLSRARR